MPIVIDMMASSVAWKIVINDGKEAELSGARNNSINGITGFKLTSHAIFPPSISFLYMIGVRKKYN